MEEEKYIVAIRCMTYNQSSYITDALNSFVMQQTKFPYLAVIFDDASTDGEQGIIKRYLEEHFDYSIKAGFKQWENEEAFYVYARHKENINCRFFVVYLKKNLYKTQRKDELIKEWCDAKYIALCEGDDYWTDPLKLQKQVDFLEEHEEVGICYTDYSRLNEATNEITHSMFEEQGQYRPTSYEQHLLRPGYLAPMTWVYRKKLLKYIEKQTGFVDGTYTYMLEWLYNSTVGYLPINTAVYRSHKGSASSPTDVNGLFRYSKGIFDIQVFYANKYSCPSELREKILVRGYLDVLPVAVMAQKEDFIEESKSYLEGKGYSVGVIIRDLKAGQAIRNSYAYRIGKMIISPFSWLKKNKRY